MQTILQLASRNPTKYTHLQYFFEVQIFNPLAHLIYLNYSGEQKLATVYQKAQFCLKDIPIVLLYLQSIPQVEGEGIFRHAYRKLSSNSTEDYTET